MNYPNSPERMRAMEQHDERVKLIASKVRSFYDRGEPFRIYHGTTSTTRKVKRSRQTVVDTSGLNHVISIDATNRVAVVEPNVSMDKLVNATLAQGFVPPVVMEFPAITVGGGFAGTAGESSSFRYGLFDRTITRIEIVMADGEIVQASKTQKPDLLEAAAGSFGTIGVVTLLEIQLLPSKPYVELTYSRVNGMEEAVKAIENCTDIPTTDYLEGIMFSLNKGLVISGKLTDKAESGLQIIQFTRPWDPWFYLHAEDILQSEADNHRVLIPVRDYFFRYDRAAFWGGTYAFQYFMTPCNAVTRWLLDGFMRTKVMYQALHKSRMSDEYIVQDIGFPYDTVGQFVEYIDHDFGFYPLWLCPLKMEENMSLRPHKMSCFAPNARSQGRMINVGLWGPGPKRYDDFIQANRNIEHKTEELNGLKCFYAQAFYTKDEFWNLYDKKWYDGVREKYKAQSLPSVYNKVNVDLAKRKHSSEQDWREWLYERFKEQWPVRGVYGVLHTFISPEYLLSGDQSGHHVGIAALILVCLLWFWSA